MEKQGKGKGNGYMSHKQVKELVDQKIKKSLVRKFFLTATGTTVSPASITNTGTMYNLESVAQGSGNQARIGNNARVIKIKYDGNLYADSTDVINVFRVVLARWNDNTTMVVGDLFTSSNYSTSYYNIDNIGTGKLQVLFDKSYCTGTTSSGAKHAHIEIKCNYPIQWNSASAVPAINGSLNLYIVSDSTAIPSPTIAGNATVIIEQ
jgi:hypothetical protein